MSNIEDTKEPLASGSLEKTTTRKQQRVKKKRQIGKEQQDQDKSTNLWNEDVKNSKVSTYSNQDQNLKVETGTPHNSKTSKSNGNTRNKQNQLKRTPLVVEINKSDKKQISKNEPSFKPAIQLPTTFTTSTIVYKNKGYKTTRSVIQKPSTSNTFQIYDSRPTFSSSLGLDREIQNVAKAIREGHAREIQGQVDSEQAQEIQQVEKAIREGHVFEIRGAVNPAVRHELLRRGWVEKPIKHKMAAKYMPDMSNSGQKNESTDRLKADSADSNHWPVAKRLLNRHAANLIWCDVTYRVFWQHAHDFQMVNKHPGDSFALKKNVMEPVQSIQWFANGPEVVNNKLNVFPRSYRLYIDEEKEAFLNDYKFTACLSLLKWFVNTVEKYQNQISKTSKVTKKDEQVTDGASPPTGEKNTPNPIEAKHLLPLLEFALSQTKTYICARKHEDIDLAPDNTKIPVNKNGGKKDMLKVTDWSQFLTQCNQITQEKTNVQLLTKEGAIEKTIKLKFNEAKEALKAVRPFWPQLGVDGVRNVWIFKPGNGIQGIGISILDKFEMIWQKFLNVDTKRTLMIAQKYLEKPMTILKTKFDIRQWFLISSWNPLTIWFYKKCYLRFSSKVFSLEDLHESIHLTNNSVQSRYKNDPERDPYLPSENMWDSTQFQNHLKKIGQPNLWSTYIYPCMKSTILALILSIQEKIVERPNSFQLMGADFLLSNDFHLYFLEINACPVLSNSTSVTSKLCPEVIQDVLKVALDWKSEGNPRADTGEFELLYQSKDVLPPPSAFKMDGSKDVLIRGKKLPVLIIPKETKFRIDQDASTNVDEQI